MGRIVLLTVVVLVVVAGAAAQEENNDQGNDSHSAGLPTDIEVLLAIILAVGALGTASFGIVEALKWTPIGVIGFGKIRETLGPAVMACLEDAYGEGNPKHYLQALYREERRGGELQRKLRQGARIGLNGTTAAGLARDFGAVVDGCKLKKIGESVKDGSELSEEERRELGRFELALDARIEAALARANTAYVGGVRVLASFTSILIALAAWKLLLGTGTKVELQHAVLAGLAAVPLAPLAKDLTSALKSATVAIQRRGA